MNGQPGVDSEHRVERRILRVGLTGGIGSGKSAVSADLTRRGAVVIDADVLARAAVAPGTSGLSAVVAEFGPTILDQSGAALDRAALAAVVFSDADALRRLEAIVHPIVASLGAVADAAAPEGSIVVHDQPLLAEQRTKGKFGHFDVVLVVDCSPETQLRRLVHARGMTVDDAKARMSAQVSRDQRLAVADYVINNDGTVDDLAASVASAWHWLSAKAVAMGVPARQD